MRRLLAVLSGLGIALVVACASATAPTHAPQKDPYTVFYVVDDMAPPLDTVTWRVRLVVADTQPPSYAIVDTQSTTVGPVGTDLIAACFAMNETLGLRHVQLLVDGDTGGLPFHWQTANVDPSVGVDTAGNTGANPWIWRLRVGDTVMDGFPRDSTSWPSNYCTF